MSTSSQLRIITVLGVAVVSAFLIFGKFFTNTSAWSEQEIKVLKSLWIGSLPATADDEKQQVSK